MAENPSYIRRAEHEERADIEKMEDVENTFYERIKG